jgi:bis(5'-nucleosyl)-tetraphosphatase (symmetrical)
MKTYVIGDVQGCQQQALALVERIEHDAGALADILFAGDLINRGPQSLAALRHVYMMAQSAERTFDSVLGNHDLHLLAVANGIRSAHKADTLDEILAAPDCDILLDWLRRRPLALMRDGHLLVHGGVLPQWTAEQTMALAHEVETVLRGPDWLAFLREMYGNGPAAWDDRLTGTARWRCIVNALTRMRYCTADGVMELTIKQELSAAGAAESGLMPWFDVPGRKTADVTVVFGHWSALGLMLRPNLIALDSGCVWGGQLSAVCLEDRTLLQVECPEYREHDGKKKH